MPQLDIAIFFNQFFWFFGLFFIVYWFFAYFVIPKLNFYYFVRYNIFVVLERFEHTFRFQSFANSLALQNEKELDVSRSLALARLCDITKQLGFQKINLQTYLNFQKQQTLRSISLKLQVQIIELFLLESFLK